MDAAHWAQVKEIYMKAESLRDSERAAFVREACGDRTSVYHEVMGLLEAGDAQADFIDEGALNLTGYVPDDRVGTSIGPYRMDKVLDQGGMGTVYLGVREDEAFHKRVAIKILKRGMDTDQVVKRFHHERHIMARLHHPAIASILDGGTTADGLPYFVMEYIEGENLLAWCDKHRLTVEQRLKLFVKICEAVQVAHQKLIVHRDLKPANILVTANGDPKLLDFGIAKLLEGEGGPGSTLTAESVAMMTPEYAAPEQILGEPITVATDIFSLGVILYGLLTGHRPFGRINTHERLMQLVTGGMNPHRPSTVQFRNRKTISGGSKGPNLSPKELSRLRQTDPRRLRRKLAGDLDNVVLKTLNREPSQRYGTVGQLADDIHRFLLGFPVLARKPSLVDASLKFLKRNKLMAAVVTLAILLPITFGVARTLEQRQTEHERDRAEEEAATASSVTDFLVDMFLDADPGKNLGANITAKEILDRGSVKIGTELAGQPNVQARLLQTIGNVYYNLDLYQKAGEMFEQAVVIRRQQVDAQPKDLAEVLYHQATNNRKLGHSVAAAREYREAVELFLEHDPDNFLLPRIYSGMASQARLENRPFQAVTLSERALDFYRLHQIRDLGLAFVHNDYAASLFYLGRYKESGDHHLIALELLTEFYSENHPDVAVVYGNIASTFFVTGDYPIAVSFLESSTKTLRVAFRGKEGLILTIQLNNLAVAHLKMGDLARAETLIEEARSLLPPDLSPKHLIWFELDYALGRIRLAQGRLGEAEVLLGRARDKIARHYGPDFFEIAKISSRLAEAVYRQGRLEEARVLLLHALAVVRPDPDVPTVVELGALLSLAEVYQDLGEYAESWCNFEEALVVDMALLSDSNLNLPKFAKVLGRQLKALGHRDLARPLLEYFYQDQVSKYGEDSYLGGEAKALLQELTTKP